MTAQGLGKPVIQMKKSDSEKQLFDIILQKDGITQIVAYDGTYFDISGGIGNMKVGTAILTYKKTDGSNQRFKLLPATQKPADGKYLALSEAAQNGSRLVLQDTAYLWKIRVAGSLNYNDTHTIFSKEQANIYSLGTSAGKKENGTSIIAWKWATKATEEQWKLHAMGNYGSDEYTRFTAVK